MKINYCLPIIKNDKTEILEIIKKNESEYQYFEIWLDYIKDPEIQFIKNLNYKLKNRVLFLFRRNNLEPIQMDFSKRIEIINALENSDSYIDLDITQIEELDYLKENNTEIKKIISYHNYKETPDDLKLHEIIDIIKKRDPEIIKISTHCNDQYDASRLLNLISEFKLQEKKYIVSGMGDHGRIVKVTGALWGNEMTFAPIKINDSSAQGQIIKKNLEQIMYLIRNS